MACRPVLTFCQRAGAKRPIVFDWTAACADFWRAGEVRAEDEVIRPSSPNGFQYRVTTAGQSGSEEPAFPSGSGSDTETAGTTYKDGSLVLTAEPLGNESLERTISDSEWEVPVGLTASDEQTQVTNGEQKTWAYLLGDSKGTYTVRNVVTFSDGEVDVGVVKIKVE